MYERAVELDPDYALATSHLGISLVNRFMNHGGDESDLERAEIVSRRAIESAPGLSRAHAARALYFSASGQHEASDQEYEEALRLGPGDHRAHFGYGLALFRRGEFERTAALWERGQPRSIPKTLGRSTCCPRSTSDSIDPTTRRARTVGSSSSSSATWS